MTIAGYRVQCEPISGRIQRSLPSWEPPIRSHSLQCVVQVSECSSFVAVRGTLTTQMAGTVGHPGFPRQKRAAPAGHTKIPGKFPGLYPTCRTPPTLELTRLVSTPDTGGSTRTQVEIS